MGTISMAPLLCEDAVDHGFADKPLIHTLRRAINPVIRILQGQSEHPIWPLFQHWYQRSNTRRTPDQLHAPRAFGAAFGFPLFPGHVAIIHSFLRIIEVETRKVDGFSAVHTNALYELAFVLLKVVAVRHHTSLSSSHDRFIFWLAYHGPVPPPLQASMDAAESTAYHGTLDRQPTDNEQAYSASIPGYGDTLRYRMDAALGRIQHIYHTRFADTVSCSISPIRMLAAGGQPFQGHSISAVEDGLDGDETDLPQLPHEFCWILHKPVDPSTPRPRPRMIQPGTKSVVVEKPPIPMHMSRIWDIIPKLPTKTPPAPPHTGTSTGADLAPPPANTSNSASLPPGVRRRSNRAATKEAEDKKKKRLLEEQQARLALPPRKRRKSHYVVINEDTGEVIPSP